jgi:hypothetical protein
MASTYLAMATVVSAEAYLEQKYSCINDIEAILQRHTFQSSHWVNEAIQNAEQ